MVGSTDAETEVTARKRIDQSTGNIALAVRPIMLVMVASTAPPITPPTSTKIEVSYAAAGVTTTSYPRVCSCRMALFLALSVIATDDIDAWVDVEKFGITYPEATMKEEK